MNTINKILILFAFLSVYRSSMAQKPVIDTAAYAIWPDIPPDPVKFSNDGKYLQYIITPELYANDRSEKAYKDLYIRSTDGSYKKK